MGVVVRFPAISKTNSFTQVGDALGSFLAKTQYAIRTRAIRELEENVLVAALQVALDRNDHLLPVEDGGQEW